MVVIKKPRLPILILPRKPQVVLRLINKHRRLPERLAARRPGNLACLVEQLQRLAEMTVVVVMRLARGAVALEQGIGHPGAAWPVLVFVEQLPAGAVLG